MESDVLQFPFVKNQGDLLQVQPGYRVVESVVVNPPLALAATDDAVGRSQRTRDFLASLSNHSCPDSADVALRAGAPGDGLSGLGYTGKVAATNRSAHGKGQQDKPRDSLMHTIRRLQS